MKQRTITALIVATLSALALAGCSGGSTGTDAPHGSASSSAASDWYATTYGAFDVIKTSGTGDDVIKLPAGAKAGIVTASYKGSANFAITGIDKKNQPTTDLLVNTIGAYQGVSAFGLTNIGNGTTTLKVTADATWTATIAPISTATALPASGHGDGVYKYDGKAGTWAITSTGDANFVVTQYTDSPMPNLAVNEIGAYKGKVPSMAGPSVVTIQSNGDWTIGQ